jgi:hypothetical protein
MIIASASVRLSSPRLVSRAMEASRPYRKPKWRPLATPSVYGPRGVNPLAVYAPLPRAARPAHFLEPGAKARPSGGRCAFSQRIPSLRTSLRQHHLPTPFPPPSVSVSRLAFSFSLFFLSFSTHTKSVMSYGGGYGGGGGGCELSSLSPSQPVRAPSHSPSRAFTSSWADPPLISSPLLGARACPSDGGGGGGYGGGGGGCRSPFSPPTSQQLRIGRSSLTTPLFPILVTQTAAVAEATAAAEVAATVAAEAATAEVRMAPAAVATAEGALAEVRPKNAHQHIPHRQSGVPFAVRAGAR